MTENDGVVLEINIATVRSELPQAVERVRAVEGCGLEGDRNFEPDGFPEEDRDHEITLIADEALSAFREEAGVELSAAESRRQVLTRGIDINGLVGRRFTIGEIECEGIELCEPCRHLQSLTKPEVLRGLVHRGGLRAAILRGGEIAPGDPVRPL